MSPARRAEGDAGTRRRYLGRLACGANSDGPNSPRPKPDFVAQVPFPIRARPRPFTGTSAAAPQAAALAALLLGRNPAMTPDQVHHALRTSAVDLLAPGHDSETGFGRLQLR